MRGRRIAAFSVQRKPCAWRRGGFYPDILFGRELLIHEIYFLSKFVENSRFMKNNVV